MLSGDPLEWLTQHAVPRLLAGSLAPLSAAGSLPAAVLAQSTLGPDALALAAKRHQHKHRLWQQAAVLQRRAAAQQEALQSAVQAVCAVLGWAEAAWMAGSDSFATTLPSGDAVQQLAAAAAAVVDVAEQLEAQRKKVNSLAADHDFILSVTLHT